MIGKHVLALEKAKKSKFINIGIFAASSGGRKGRRHIGSFTPDRERSHVCLIHLIATHNECVYSVDLGHKFGTSHSQ